MSKKLPRYFYERDDVVAITKELIGKVLCSNIDGYFTSGIIVEAEAYNGREDRACHAYPDLRTSRTAVLYEAPGVAYVYLCYGIHHLFNIVTNKEGLADAILIRGIEPVEGIDHMLDRRDKTKLDHQLTNGPGKLAQAMGITTSYYGSDLTEDVIWIEDHGHTYDPKDIIAAPRIGVDYAGEHAELPWRFYVKDSKWVSKR